MSPLAWGAIIAIIGIVAWKNKDKITTIFQKKRGNQETTQYTHGEMEKIRKDRIEYLQNEIQQREQKIELIKQDFNKKIMPITEEIEQIKVDINLLQPQQQKRGIFQR